TVSALVLNKIIGTGIYTSPKIVLAATGSKGISLMLWLLGGVMTWAGIFIYIEYGIRWPVTGGELYYIENIFKRPPRLLTYIFSSIFVVVNGLQVNALVFGQEIIVASSPVNAPINQNLQKFFAIIIATFICQLQAYSRFLYIKLGNTLAVVKVVALLFIVICGLAALGKARVTGANEIETSYGKADLSNAFASGSGNPYQYALALLNVMRAFLGYENANFVLEEVRAGPPGDERRIFRRAVKASVGICIFLYVMVNVAIFTVCTTEEIINTPNTISLFFQKVFGVSDHAHVGSAIMIAISGTGSMIASTFANVRVKQEIGRLGVLPIPEFWSKTSHRRTPAHSLFLHWIFSVILIAVTPLDNAAGFLIMSTFWTYMHTYIGIPLGLALLCAPWISAFNFEGGRVWKPQSSTMGWWLLAPLTVIYVASNTFVLAVSWIPANLQQTTHSTGSNLPYFTGPVAGLGVIAFGISWWCWDLHVLPFLGYKFWTEEDELEYSEEWNVKVLTVHFHVSIAFSMFYDTNRVETDSFAASA
ncbi:amino acid transporter, partial [Mollisia scopiformis]